MNDKRTTHTPGPWTDGRDVPVRGHSEIGLGLCYIAATDPGSLSDLEARANARLIAAAPDLLEALKAIRNASKKNRVDPDAIHEIAAGAIAQAEGTQS